MSECTNGSEASRTMMVFATGALLGAGLALLFAPKTGKQTREMLASKTRDLKDEAGDMIERGKHLVNNVKHEAREAFKKGKDVAHDASNEVKQRANETTKKEREFAYETSGV